MDDHKAGRLAGTSEVSFVHPLRDFQCQNDADRIRDVCAQSADGCADHDHILTRGAGASFCDVRWAANSHEASSSCSTEVRSAVLCSTELAHQAAVRSFSINKNLCIGVKVGTSYLATYQEDSSSIT